jgi:hypothetical protein
MGNASSNDPNAITDADRQVGYRILGIQDDSPASHCQFVIYFDFIVAANGIMLTTLDSTFVDIIQAFENKELSLTIYNSKTKQTRTVTMVPSRSSWTGDGLLGVTIRFDTYANCDENVCRICEIENDSPADLAGLVEETDYILGSAEKVYPDMDLLFKDLQENLNKPMELFIWNSKTDKVRIVIIMPSLDWGTNNTSSILGATIAHGYLHGLPSFRENTEGNGLTADQTSPNASSDNENTKLHADEGAATAPLVRASSGESSISAPKSTQSVFGNHDKMDNSTRAGSTGADPAPAPAADAPTSTA